MAEGSIVFTMELFITKMPHHFTTKDGADIGYFMVGNKRRPTLILHNGLSCNTISLLHIIKNFKSDFHILYIAHRGHMGSSLGSLQNEQLKIDVLVRDTRFLMDHLKIKKAIHLGFSMGVQVCFEFYKFYPERCLAFVVMGGTAGKVFQGRPGGQIVESLLLPFLKKTIKQYEKQINTAWKDSGFFDTLGWAFNYIGEDGKRMSKRELKYFFKHFTYFNPEAFLAYGKSLTEQDAHYVLPDIEIPTIIFGGGHDMFVPLSFQENLHQQIPDSELIVFPDGSHLFPIAYKNEICEALVKFFTKQKFLKRKIRK